MSFQAKDDAVLGLQLKVQEIVVKSSDVGVFSGSGTAVSINVGEAIAEVRAALHVDEGAGSVLPIIAANRVVSGSSVALTLGTAIQAADCIILKYVVAE